MLHVQGPRATETLAVLNQIFIARLAISHIYCFTEVGRDFSLLRDDESNKDVPATNTYDALLPP